TFGTCACGRPSARVFWLGTAIVLPMWRWCSPGVTKKLETLGDFTFGPGTCCYTIASKLTSTALQRRERRCSIFLCVRGKYSLRALEQFPTLIWLLAKRSRAALQPQNCFFLWFSDVPQKSPTGPTSWRRT